jgi:non-specific serine/threonine protein kinase
MVGTLLASRFELIARINQDAYGTVYRARDHGGGPAGVGRLCAVRVLPAKQAEDPEIRARVEELVGRHRLLRHKGILAYHEFGMDERRTWVVGELPEGTTLSRFVRKECLNGLPPDRGIPIVSQIAGAVAAAHDAGMMHGDLRPSSLYISSEGKVRVADFGLRVAIYGSRIPTAQAGSTDIEQMGTMDAYLTLEILDGKPPTAADDVYSLACIAAVLLTGSHPFNGRSARRRLEKDLPPPRIRALGKARNRALAKGLALKQEERFESVREFIGALESPPPDRRPVLWTATLLILLVAAAGAAWPLLQWLEQRDTRDQIEMVRSATWPELRAELRELAGDREAVLGAVSEHVQNNYEQAIREALAAEEPVAAQALLQELRLLYPGSDPVARLTSDVDEIVNRHARRIAETLGNRFEAGELGVRDDGVDVPNLVAALRRLTPEHPLAQGDTLERRYRAAVAEMRETGSRAEVAALKAAINRLFPDAPDLHVAARRMALAVEERDAGLRQSEVESRLRQAGTPRDMNDIVRQREQIVELKRLGGAAPWFEQHRQGIQSIVAVALAEARETGDLGVANALLRDNAPFLDTAWLTAQRRELSRLQLESDYQPPSLGTELETLQQHREAVEALLADPRLTPLWHGELLTEWRRLIAWLRPGRPWVDNLRTRLEETYVVAGRERLEAGDRQGARDIASRGRKLVPGSTALEDLAREAQVD